MLKGTQAAWKDNDPQYAAAVITGVNQISEPVKLNDKPIVGTSIDDTIDLTANPAADYRFGVYAYIVRAVNRLGVESGPSPYALTIPSEPVICTPLLSRTGPLTASEPLIATTPRERSTSASRTRGLSCDSDVMT